MFRLLSTFGRLAVAILILMQCALYVSAAHAQEILRDAETENLLGDLTRPLVHAANLDASSVKVVLLNDSDVNAFVAGGQTIYINSGLLLEADNAAQVQAVIAHELGHIAGGHAIDDRGMKKAGHINIVSLALGAVAAATGNGDAAMGIVMAGQQAAIGSYLAYTRIEEESADAAGARYLSAAGLSGRASIDFFHHLLTLENRAGVKRTADDQFWSTHPLTNDRIAMLTDTYEHSKAWNTPYDDGLNARFQRVKAKLTGYLHDPEQTLGTYQPSDMSTPAHYARAYAYAKHGSVDAATSEMDAALQSSPHDAYMLETKGDLLLEGGRPDNAIEPLRAAALGLPDNTLVATSLAHALFVSDELSGADTHRAEAKRIISAAIARDRLNPFSWHVLGMIHEANGDASLSQLAAAEEAMLTGHVVEARQLANRIHEQFPAGSREAIQADDILNESHG